MCASESSRFAAVCVAAQRQRPAMPGGELPCSDLGRSLRSRSITVKNSLQGLKSRRCVAGDVHHDSPGSPALQFPRHEPRGAHPGKKAACGACGGSRCLRARLSFRASPKGRRWRAGAMGVSERPPWKMLEAPLHSDFLCSSSTQDLCLPISLYA